MSITHSHHVEIMAEEIRQAAAIIGQLMGEITPEDILNKIFSQFCVGK
jgi:tRNA modification GTPase